MAKTFYKYQDREPSSFIDWSVIGKSITDDLSNKVQQREEKKAEIEKTTKDMITKLNDVQLGENDGLNKFWLDGAAQITENSLILNRLLKSGKINMKDYNIRIQNMQDGVSSGIQLINELNTSYTEAMERFKKGESSALEQWSMSKTEQFGNFGNSGMVVNPSNYVINVAKTDEKGNVKDTMSFQQLRKINKQRYDKFNAKTEVASIVGQLAKQYENVIRKGGVLTLDDVRQNPNMKAALDKYVEAALVNPNAALDLLMEYAPENYDIESKGSNDVAKAKAEGKVYVELDPNNPSSGRYVAVLSEEQKKEAKDILLGLIDVAIPKGVEPMPVFAPKTPTPKNTSGDNAATNAINMLKFLYSGNPDEIAASISYFEGMPGIARVNRKPDGVQIEFEDEKKPDSFISFGKNFDLFAKSALALTGVKDTEKAVKQAGGSVAGSPTGFEVGSGTEIDMQKLFKADLVKAYQDSINLYEQEEGITVENLNNLYKDLGVRFEGNDELVGADRITVVVGEEGKEIRSSEISLNNPVIARDAVFAFLKDINIPRAAFENYSKKGPVFSKGKSASTGGKNPKPY